MKINRWLSPSRLPASALALGLFLLAGCNGSDTTGPSVSGDAPADTVPDFSLADQNPGSPTFGEDFSPRQFVGQVSAWYFGHST